MPSEAPAAEIVIPATAPPKAVRWGYFLASLGLPLAAAGYAAWLTIFTYTHYGPIAALYRPRPFWLIALILAAVSLLLCMRSRWRRQSFLRLTPTGLTIRLAPHAPFSILWREIRAIEMRVSRPLLRKQLKGAIVLHLRDGSRQRLDHRFPDLPALARLLQRSLYTEHLPEMRRLWASGYPLQFGTLRVDRQGLIWRSQSLPWRTIQRVSIKAGRVVIELKAGNALSLPLHRIHNPDILLWWLRDEAKR